MEFEKHVKIRHEKFGTVVFETLGEKVFVTNESGGKIIQLLEEGKEVNEIIEELVKNYNSQPIEIKADVDEFISILKDKGIIKK
jgi:hypothetical protein